MAEKVEDSSSARAKYLDYIFQVTRQNENFLHENSEELYVEIIELNNDAIDHIRIATENRTVAEEYVKSSVLYFLYHVLMPIGGAIYINTLIGNLPACFMELRLALESLVKCYFADQRYPESEFFRDRLHLFEKKVRGQNTSISSLMNELDKHLGLKKDSITLWGKLSESWVHARGVMDGIVDHVIEKSDAPPWGLVIPANYTSNDLSSLNELRKRLDQFRVLLEIIFQKHRQRV